MSTKETPTIDLIAPRIGRAWQAGLMPKELAMDALSRLSELELQRDALVQQIEAMRWVVNSARTEFCYLMQRRQFDVEERDRWRSLFETADAALQSVKGAM